MIGSLGLHFTILLVIFIYPLIAFEKKVEKVSYDTVKVNIDNLLTPSPQTPTTSFVPPTPEPEVKPEPEPEPEVKPEPKLEPKVDDSAVKERAQEIKDAALAEARKIKAAKDKKAAEEKAKLEKLAKDKKKKADQEKRARDLKNKKDREAKAAKDKAVEAKKDKELKERKAREAKEKAAAVQRWREKVAKEKAAQQAAAAQKTMKDQYKGRLSAEVTRLWDNIYIPNTAATDSSDRVYIQVTIRRDGYVMSKKITKHAKSPALRRKATLFMAQLKKLPAFPKSLKDSQITETLNLGLE